MLIAFILAHAKKNQIEEKGNQYTTNDLRILCLSERVSVRFYFTSLIFVFRETFSKRHNAKVFSWIRVFLRVRMCVCVCVGNS